MRHAKARHQLNRFTSWHRATIAGMMRSLLTYQRIETTLAKAKAVRPHIEKLIALAREDSLANKRRAFRMLSDHRLVSLLFNDIAKRFSGREGGYIRILRLGNRRGDNAQLALLELTEVKTEGKKQKKTKAEKEINPETKAVTGTETERPPAEKEHKTKTAVKEKRPATRRPSKNFLGGLKGIFKKERDSL
ncbi:MAG: 50S ribosomal protein L17 [Candidatus Omnitrophica bacterium]|nr:50S ribosomal protein L17 [Candidatus Omnitrophota bacterium]